MTSFLDERMPFDCKINGNIKYLTVNVGLLDYAVMGFIFYSNPPHSSKRYSYIPPAIEACNPDIVTIQECYSIEHSNYICDKLKHILPFSARRNGVKGMFNLHNGLLILSRWEIIESEILYHIKGQSCLESCFADKSTLIAKINIPTYGILCVMNIHATAGDLFPGGEVACAGRAFCIGQALEYIDRDDACRDSFIFSGDFNCGPEDSPENFEIALKRGLRDGYAEARTKTGPQFTWDPQNALNVKGPHRQNPAARIDHIFLPESVEKIGQVHTAEVVFHESDIPISKKNSITTSLSDHYGVLVEIELK